MANDETMGVQGGVRILLRLEGLALLCATAIFYAETGASWRLFAILFLAPDLSMLAYVGGSRIGAAAYNFAHSTIVPIMLAAVSLSRLAPLPGVPLLPIALIWLAHIGFDRALGYGLKYAHGFSQTHLGRIGRKAQA